MQLDVTIFINYTDEEFVARQTVSTDAASNEAVQLENTFADRIVILSTDVITAGRNNAIWEASRPPKRTCTL